LVVGNFLHLAITLCRRCACCNRCHRSVKLVVVEFLFISHYRLIAPDRITLEVGSRVEYFCPRSCNFCRGGWVKSTNFGFYIEFISRM